MELINIVFGSLISAIGVLLLANQQTTKQLIKNKFDELSKRMDLQDEKINGQDERVQELAKSFLACKQNCFQEFTKKEDWLREAGNNREQLSDVSKTLSRMEGKMGIMEQLPQICGNIAREIALEMKG
jgi:hypothetical protein